MGYNKRLPATVTRSLSFRFDLLAALDERVVALRSDRSTVVNGILEHMLGIAPHPELVGRNVPFVADRDRTWADRATELEKAALAELAQKREHREQARASTKPPNDGLVRRVPRR